MFGDLHLCFLHSASLQLSTSCTLQGPHLLEAGLQGHEHQHKLTAPVRCGRSMVWTPGNPRGNPAVSLHISTGSHNCSPRDQLLFLRRISRTCHATLSP